jgi:carbamoyl-phosphate synthase large subunit
MVAVATNVMLGRSLAEQGYRSGLWPRQNLVAVKAPVFSMAKLVGVDTYLGPEMKSTGEVMGVDSSFYQALTKALLAAQLMLPPTGALLLSIADRDKPEALPLIQRLHRLGYRFYATEGTAAMLQAVGLPVQMITKRLHQGHPNVIDVIREGLVQGVVNTITGGRSEMADGFQIRRAATERGIPCFTSLDTLRAVIESLAHGGQHYSVRRLSEYRQQPLVEVRP